MAATLPVIAHQGGWDEILFVLAPLAVFALLLYVASRRVQEAGERDSHEADLDGPDTDGPDTDGPDTDEHDPATHR